MTSETLADRTLKAFADFLRTRGLDDATIAGLSRGEADVALTTGPHLGNFNDRTSLPELGEAVAAAVAGCLAARHDRDRAGKPHP